MEEGRRTRARPTRQGSDASGKSSQSNIRKSPARTKSPSRKGASPPKETTMSTGIASSGIAISNKVRARGGTRQSVSTPTPTPTPKEATPPIKEKNEPKTTIIPVTKLDTNTLPLLKGDLKSSSSTYSISTEYSSSTSTVTTVKSGDTVDIGPNKNLDLSNDSEIAKLTSLASFVRRSMSKTITPRLSANRHLTPTPTTERSHHSRSISRSVYDEEDEDDDYSRTEYSDNENDANFDNFNRFEGNKYTFGHQINPATNFGMKYNISRKIVTPKEYGGAFGAAFLVILMPLLIFYLQYTCNKQSCEFNKIDLSSVKTLQSFLNFQTIEKFFHFQLIGSYFLFTNAIVLISAVPFGRVVRLYNDRGITQYYFNSLATAVLVAIGFFIAENMQYNVAEFIMKNYIKFCAFSMLHALFLSVWCFLRSRYVSQNLWNPYAKTGNFFIDFFIGREINPKWFQIVDIKLVSYRISLIKTFLLSLIFIYKNIQLSTVGNDETDSLSFVAHLINLYNSIRFDTTSLLTSSLLLIYVMDLIIYEHHLASSFELQQEGVGALALLHYAILPFALAIVPKYTLQTKRYLLIPGWAIALISIIFIFGLMLKRSSNKIKYQYRMNPNRSELALMETVPTFQGRRLLLGKLWGSVRQPNYLGELISLIAFATPLYWKFAWPPIISIGLIILFLIHRAIRVNARNFARYNSAWTRYCSRVRHILVPKVF